MVKVSGYKSYGYDKFGQRTYLKYGNGTETTYTYDRLRTRLENLRVSAGGSAIMDNTYTYDAVSNVLGVANGAKLPEAGRLGGNMHHTYEYDALYRLTGATGTYAGSDSKSASYTLKMTYDNMYRVTGKSQHLSQTGVQFDGTLSAGYDLKYTYSGEEVIQLGYGTYNYVGNNKIAAMKAILIDFIMSSPLNPIGASDMTSHYNGEAKLSQMGINAGYNYQINK